MCGIFGITDSSKASFLTYIALYSLQHRGQESCGIAVFGKNGYKYYNSMGLVQEVFNSDILKMLEGEYAIGHVRYSTTGSSTITNSQPLFFRTKFGEFAVAHNGNIVNSEELKKELSKKGSIFQTTTDSEIIAHLISLSDKKDFVDALCDGLEKLKGAYSFLFLYQDCLICARDPWGFRPLVVGRKDDSFIFTSETCAIDCCGYEVYDEIFPGEIGIVRNGKYKKFKFKRVKNYFRCIFEQVYFARPDSLVCERSVFSSRYFAGKYLAEEYKINADIVSGVPDSGVAYAIGYAQKSNMKFMPVFMKNHYAPRSFLQPHQDLREFIADLKLSPIKDNIRGKKIILIDDSLVRGTTSKKIVSKLRNAGASKVYLIIGSPPVKGPCYYGIDTPSEKELIANIMDIDSIKKFIGVDELFYISLASLIKACGNGDKNFCTACFDRKYPVL
ncbi:MAG: amidophosphoribosyltransferase [Elusimicrobiales bacterium]|nr:amidophosphoribosyltransferase [Elusimicrobiales bacterium]